MADEDQKSFDDVGVKQSDVEAVVDHKRALRTKLSDLVQPFELEDRTACPSLTCLIRVQEGIRKENKRHASYQNMRCSTPRRRLHRFGESAEILDSIALVFVVLNWTLNNLDKTPRHISGTSV